MIYRPLTSNTSAGSLPNSSVDDEVPSKDSEQDDSVSPQASSEQRRELLESKLNNYKREN